MKKIRPAMLVIVFLSVLILGNASVLANEAIKVFVNGAQVQFDQPPIIQEGRTLVPMRAIFEAIGMTVGFDEPTQVISVNNGDMALTMQIDDAMFLVNDREHSFDVPPTIINGRTLVPVGQIFAAINYNVSWDEAALTIHINNKDNNEPEEAEPNGALTEIEREFLLKVADLQSEISQNMKTATLHYMDGNWNAGIGVFENTKQLCIQVKEFQPPTNRLSSANEDSIMIADLTSKIIDEMILCGKTKDSKYSSKAVEYTKLTNGYIDSFMEKCEQLMAITN